MRSTGARMVRCLLQPPSTHFCELDSRRLSVLPSLRLLGPCPTAPAAPPSRRVAPPPLAAVPSAGRQFTAAAPSLPAFFGAPDDLGQGPLALGPGDVHVWWLRHPAAGTDPLLCDLHPALAALMPPEDAAECAASKDPAAGELRLLARAFSRSVLSRYLQRPFDSTDGTETHRIHPGALVFERNAHGKPELAHPAAAVPLRFNLTHTPGMVGVAVAAGVAVGLDAEATARRTRGEPLRLARRRFAAAEVAALEAAGDDDTRAALFMRLWTLKEAYVKAVGRGISAPPGLRGFAFQLREEEGALDFESVSEGGGGAAGWHFALMEPGDGHLAALCCEKSPGGATPRVSTFLADTAAPDQAAVPCDPRILAVGPSPAPARAA